MTESLEPLRLGIKRKIDEEKFRQMWNNGVPNYLIAKTFDIHATYPSTLAKKFGLSSRKYQKGRFVSNGLIEETSEEFQSFPARVRLLNKGKDYYSAIVTIPSEICKKIQIKHKSFLEVAVRKMPFLYLYKTYGALSKGILEVKRGRKVRSIQVICPICNQLGNISIRKPDIIVIRHGRLERRHYISKYKFPKEHIQFMNMKDLMRKIR